MPTELFKAYRDFKPLLKDVFGNLENLIAKNNYTDALRVLKNKYEEPYNKEQRYRKVLDSLRSVSLVDNDYYNTTKGIDYDNPEILKSNAYQQYLDKYLTPYREKLDKPQAEGQTTPPQLTFEQYIAQDPVLQNEITSKFLKENKELLSDEDITNLKFQKAGLNPDDIEFFKSYKPINVGEHNKRLSSLLLDNYPYLISSGSSGDSYAKLFGSALQDFSLPELKNRNYEIRVDEKSGNVLFIDPETGSVIKKPYMIPSEQKEKKPFSFGSEEEIIAYTTEDGQIRYGIFKPNPSKSDGGNKGWEYTGVDATPNQVEEFTKTGIFAPKRRSYNRRVRTGPAFNVDKLTKDEIGGITANDIRKMSVANRKKLFRYEDYLTESARKALNDEDLPDDEEVDALPEEDMATGEEIINLIIQAKADLDKATTNQEKQDILDEVYDALDEFKASPNFSDAIINNAFDIWNDITSKVSWSSQEPPPVKNSYKKVNP